MPNGLLSCARSALLPVLLVAGLGAASEPTPPAAPPTAAKPWVPLFDGKRDTLLAHFTAFRETYFPKEGWTVEADGSLHVHGGPDLISKESYGDFELELEWKAAEQGNSGLFYRIETHPDQPIYRDAFECQMYAPKDMKKTHPVYRPGALYNLFGNTQENSLHATGEWNTLRVVAQGNHLTHTLNGVVVVDSMLDSPEYAKALARSKFKTVTGYGEQKSGPIGLQSDGGELWFRAIRIRALD